MTSLTIPDAATANAFISASYGKYTSCITGFGPVSIVASQTATTVDAAVAAASSAPSQVFGVLQILVGAAMLVYGYKLVRPINFVAGAYLGATLSLLLLNIFAPALANCPAIVAIGTLCGLGLGVLCALKRESAMLVLGLVSGEIVGDLFFKIFLAGVVPEYVAFGCIGFFAVLLGVLAGRVGDFAFKVACSFFGGYLIIANLLKLLFIPFVPTGASFLAFLSFKPELTAALTGAYTTTLVNPYVYGPTIVLLALTATGSYVQVKLLRRDEQQSGLIMK